jgi:hypothetical protein
MVKGVVSHVGKAQRIISNGMKTAKRRPGNCSLFRIEKDSVTVNGKSAHFLLNIKQAFSDYQRSGFRR